METKMHVCFRAEQEPQLYDYIKTNNIPFEKSALGTLTFDISNTKPFWKEIESLVNNYNSFRLYETSYSKDELCSAEWLHIRSKWKSGYPQPEGKFDYENITYTRKDHCNSCGCGLVQIDSFRIKKTPKWGHRHFMELNWIGDELFADDSVCSVLKLNNVSGISFMGVYDQKGHEKLDDINQIVISNHLEKGIIEDSDSIKAIEYCSQCGEKKFLYSGVGMLSFRRELFEGVPDIVKTAEYFGSGHYAQKMILINQRVYQLIAKNKLDKALVFEPINLV